MAIKKSEVKKIQKDHMKNPLTEKELNAISVIEKMIDEKILEKTKYGESIVRIELGYVNFNYKIDGIEMTPEMRSTKMRDEIDKRYKDSGWKIRVEYDDGLDGPDYWVLY